MILVYSVLKWLNYSLRQIPGPKGSLLMGNSKDLSKPNDGHKVLIEWGKKYGDVYKTWDIIGIELDHFVYNPVFIFFHCESKTLAASGGNEECL